MWWLLKYMNIQANLPNSHSGLSPRCIGCASDMLSQISFPRPVRTVTSDCRPWDYSLRLALCERCGLAQSLVDDAWRHSASKIYRDYNSYFQSSLKDQLTFGHGEVDSRTQRFIKAVLSVVSLPTGSSVLDFGCGSGNVLRSLSALRHDLILDGYDLDSRVEKELKEIPGFRHLHSSQIPSSRKYDLIILSHALEHLEHPVQSLKDLTTILSDSGSLAIAVPDCSADPLKLTVADHCTHFSPVGLKHWLGSQGFTSLELSQGGDSRECLVIARKESDSDDWGGPLASGWFYDATTWVATAADKLERFQPKTQVGVLGTAIAASWIIAQRPNLIKFCVDEDASRNREFHDRPVFDLASVPRGSYVLVPFSGLYEKKVLRRLRLHRLDVHWVGLDEIVNQTY